MMKAMWKIWLALLQAQRLYFLHELFKSGVIVGNDLFIGGNELFETLNFTAKLCIRFCASLYGRPGFDTTIRIISRKVEEKEEARR